ncbi:hypothetical protein GF354_04240, partial [Candidatus Peregrinibacteria bacterium]|nr:hypothetical protein [Candidatus Peregrinibacteria bacterium]
MQNEDFNPVEGITPPGENKPEENNGKSRTLLYVLLGLAVLALLGGAVYYFFFRTTIEEPPSLSLGTAGVQGFIGTGTYLEFTDEDLTRTSAFSDVWEQNSGVNHYHSSERVSFQTIANDIVPEDKSLKCLIAYYDTSASNFFTYPEGQFKDTELVSEDELDSYFVEAEDGFTLVCSDSYSINKENGIMPATEMPSALTGSNDLNPISSGWHLMAFSSSGDLRASLANCYNRVSSVWVQDGVNSFAPQYSQESELLSLDDILSINMNDGYYLVWLKFFAEAQT